MRPDDARVLTIETIDIAGGVVLRCEGELDFSNEAELKEALETLLDRRLPYVCLDLRDLDFADTTVLRVLESVEKSAQERDVSLEMIPGPAVQRLLDALA
jgi:anti-anti-sigma factor